MSTLQEEEETCPPQPPSKMSPFVLKLRSAPPNYFFQPPNASSPMDLFAAPAGPYFFYGTLSDPSLAEILNVDHEPTFRPAYIMGYKTKLWGQCPALIDAPGEVVEGVVHHVRTVGDADRLAEYETGKYGAEACLVRYIDGERPEKDLGYTFKFGGDSRDLREGAFNLKV